MSPSAAFGFEWPPVIPTRKPSCRHSRIFSRYLCTAEHHLQRFRAHIAGLLRRYTSSAVTLSALAAVLAHQVAPQASWFALTKDRSSQNGRANLQNIDSRVPLGEKLRLELRRPQGHPGGMLDQG